MLVLADTPLLALHLNHQSIVTSTCDSQSTLSENFTQATLSVTAMISSLTVTLLMSDNCIQGNTNTGTTHVAVVK